MPRNTPQDAQFPRDTAPLPATPQTTDKGATNDECFCRTRLVDLDGEQYRIFDSLNLVDCPTHRLVRYVDAGRPVADPTTVSAADIRAAMERIRDEAYEPNTHRHVVHPDSRTVDGWYGCAGLCGQAFYFENGRPRG